MELIEWKFWDVQCKYCGKDNLHWTYLNQELRLKESDETIHICKETKMKPTTNDWQPKGARKEMQCKYCEAGGLHWAQLSEGWRLVESDETIHRCGKLTKSNSIEEPKESHNEFVIDAMDVGFTQEQAEFLWLKLRGM